MENSEGKMPSPPHHPHDMLFKAVFKRPANVRELLEAKAPKSLLAILDLGSLRLTDASYVDEELAKQMADIVLECDTDKDRSVRFSFILEHKSYVPTYPPLQIMRYQGLAWAMQIEDKSSRPAPLVPVVFFHGKQKWTVKPWKDYLEGWREEFTPYTPPGGYIFIDLSKMADEEIKRFRSGFMVTALLLMKHRFERDFLLENLAETVNFVESDEKVHPEVRFKNIQYILRYLQGLRAITWAEARQKLNSLKMTNQAMDVLEDVKIEAYQEGIEQGIEQGQKRKNYFGTYNMLRKGFSPVTISGILDVPISFVADIKKQLEQVSRITELLKKGNEVEGLAKKLKVPVLFVEAVKLELEKK